MIETERGAREFAAGDRLYFLKNERSLGVKNGSLGTVEKVRDGVLQVRLDGAASGTGEGERRVAVDTRWYNHLDHGYAATVYKAQGGREMAKERRSTCAAVAPIWLSSRSRANIVYTVGTPIMTMRSISVGIREFRARLADYLLKSDKPVAVTRHGETIGYFIPARAGRAELDRAALKKAASKMEELLEREGLSEPELEEIGRDFKASRKSRK